MMQPEVLIDGSQGEGGGQVLRTSLTLSLLTRKTFRLINIRAKRKNPGLAAQHLQSIQSAAAISNSQVEGAHLGSSEIIFHPNDVQRGDYNFDIGTAGSTSLVFQTVCYPLSRNAPGSRVTIRGGTHVSHAPSFDYLSLHWLPWLKRLGYEFQLQMRRAGYYPKGGGEIQAVCGVHHQAPDLCLEERGRIQEMSVFTTFSKLPFAVAENSTRTTSAVLKQRNFSFNENTTEVPAIGSGYQTAIHVRYENGGCMYFALSERGISSQEIGRRAADRFLFFDNRSGAIDEHLADQLLIPAALNRKPVSYTTPGVTQHLLTNRDIILKFMNRTIEISGSLGEPGSVKIS